MLGVGALCIKDISRNDFKLEFNQGMNNIPKKNIVNLIINLMKCFLKYQVIMMIGLSQFKQSNVGKGSNHSLLKCLRRKYLSKQVTSNISHQRLNMIISIAIIGERVLMINFMGLADIFLNKTQSKKDNLKMVFVMDF